MSWEPVAGHGGGQPGVTIVPDPLAQYHEDFLNDNIASAKPANKKGKKKDDKSPKEEKKKPVVPIATSFEGYVLTVIDPLRPGESASWVRTRKAQMPFNSQELYDKAMAHQKKTGLGLTGQFQNLGPNQQTLVNRLVAEKNLSEKEPNAEWNLFGVKKLYEERKSTFKTMRVNNAIRVTLRRGDKAKDTVQEILPKTTPLGRFVDPTNIVDLRDPLVKKDPAPKEKDSKEKDKKEAEKEKEKKNKKKNKKADKVEAPIDPGYGPHPAYDHGHNENDYLPPWPQTPGPETWSTQTQHPDPFSSMPQMSGGLPADAPLGAIPIPPHHQHPQQHHDAPPEVPMAPLPQHFHQGHPFQPDPRLFAQPHAPPFDHLDERRPRTPVAYNQQPMSARRPSHSRTRSEHHPRAESQRRPQSRRRDSVSSEARRAMEEDRLAAVVRDQVRGALRDATAENKVLHYWPTSPSGSGGSSRSFAQDDFWSNAGSSGDRRPSYVSTPGTSPERYFDNNRPTDALRRRDSARPFVDERKRYYPERQRDYVMRPHETYRDHDRDRGREPRYVRDRRQNHDDYPTAHSRQRSRDPHYDMMRPRVVRALTDHPATLRDANFRREERGRGVDYERVRANDRDARRGPYTVHEVRQDGRRPQPAYW